MSALVFAGFLCISAPGSFITIENTTLRKMGWRGIADRFFLIPLPMAAFSFTHHYIMSHALWSKNEKTIWDVNWQSTGLNTLLWLSLCAGGTRLSRYVLPKLSREYRLKLWDWQRNSRGVQHPYLCSFFGTLSDHFSWVYLLWYMNVYHLLWMGITMLLDRQMHSHYAMFYKSLPYSRWCSPRWREWRESEVLKEVLPKQQPNPHLRRWGSVLQLDEWREWK